MNQQRNKSQHTSNGVYQKFYKGIFLPFCGTTIDLDKWRLCKCNDTKKCQTLTEELKAIGDIHGTFAQIPTCNPLQPLTLGTVTKKEKLMRWMKHLQRTDKLMDFASINNENNQQLHRQQQ